MRTDTLRTRWKAVGTLISLRTDNVYLCEEHNRCNRHDFGFVPGAETFVGDGGASARWR